MQAFVKILLTSIAFCAVNSLFAQPCPPINAGATSTTPCAENSFQLIANTISGASYSWTGPYGYVSSAQNPAIISAAGLHTGKFIVAVTKSGCGTYKDSVQITTQFCNTPQLQVSDSLSYCAKSSICKPVAQNLTITGTGNISNAKVYFGSGYAAGDTLNVTTISGVSQLFSPSTGVLTLTGTASLAQYQAILRSVCYRNTSLNAAPGVRTIYFLIGDALYNSGNGHYYSLVSGGAVTWANAAAAANASNYFGLQGYLVTVTSAQENAFLTTLIQSNSWMGASDADTEGVWRWVTGCEGLEAGGKGRHFSNQNKTGNCFAITAPGINGYYANWLPSGTYTGEPNDCGCNTANHCEDFAHFIYNPASNNGTWNDLKNSGDGSVFAYIIEYGCMPNEPTLQLSGSVKVNVLPAPAISITPATAAVCAGQSITLTAGGAATYSWSPAGSLSTAAGATVSATPSATTAYTVTGTDVNGCTDTARRTVTINPLPAAPSVISPVNYCQGAAATTLSATGTGLKWYTSATGGSAAATAPTPATAAPGSAVWYVSQTFATGCEGPRAAITVIVSALPALSTAPAASAICAGQSVIIVVSGAATYVWNPAAGLSANTGDTVTAIPAGTTTYTVTGTNAAGCSASLPVPVTVNAVPASPQVSTPIAYCQNAAAIPLNAVGANLKWYTSATGGSAATTAPTPATTTPGSTTWYVSQTSAAGCESSRAPLTVTVNPLPIISYTPSGATICAGQSVSITASGATSYYWSPATGLNTTSGATVTAAPAVTTSYTLTGTGSAGCSAVLAIPVTVNPVPAAPVVSTPVVYCQGAGASALTATGTSLLWYTSASGGGGIAGAPTPSTATAGSTTWYVSQSLLGCESGRSVLTVNILPLPSVTVNPPGASLCAGQSRQLTASGAAAYAWSPAAGLNTAAGGTITATPSASITYTVTGTGANGCSNTATSAITIIPVPLPPLVTTPQAYCKGSATVMLSAAGSNLLWYGTASGGIGSPASPTPLSATAGSTTWYVSQTVAGCESGRAGLEVVIHPLPPVAVSAPVTESCPGAVLTLTAAGAASYTWNTAYTSGNPAADTIRIRLNAPGTYIVEGTDSNGCKATAFTTLTPFPTYSITDSATICKGDSILFANAWRKSGGAYSYRFATINGCDSVVTLQLAERRPSGVSIGLPSDACLHDSVRIRLTMSGQAVTPTWSLDSGDAFVQLPFSYIRTAWHSPGMKTVTLLVANAPCPAYAITDSIRIHEPPVARIRRPANARLCSGDTLRLEALEQPGAQYFWHYITDEVSTQPGILLRPQGDRLILLSVTDRNHCSAGDSLFIDTEPCCLISLPDAFTPNGDGRNDVFRLLSAGHHAPVNFRIFNRWGEVVFSTSRQDEGWDGRFKGQMADIGTYSYVLVFDCDGREIMQRGNVTLIR